MRRVFNNIKKHKNWHKYYLHKYLTGLKNGFAFQCRGGLTIEVPLRLLPTYKECFFDETYLKGLPQGSKQKPVRSIVDNGANVGYFSLFMFSNHPNATIYAYEPIPVNFQLLSRYQKENPELHFKVINQAVGRPEEKSIELHYDQSDCFTTAASIFENENQPDCIQVKTTCLEKLMRENNLFQIDFLKLDCEGSEYDILYTAPHNLLEKVSIIVIETHQGKAEGENLKSLVEYLGDNQFETNVVGSLVWCWRI